MTDQRGIGMSRAVHVVKKRREVAQKGGSSEDDEEWFAEEEEKRTAALAAAERSGRPASRGSQSGTERPESRGSEGGLGSSAARGKGKGTKYKSYWSQLLGCKIQAERKRKKPKILVLGELFALYLQRTHGIDKEERLQMVDIVIRLLRKDGGVRSRVSIDEAVRQRVAEERRFFRFGDDATDLIQAQKKKNGSELQFVQLELDVTQKMLKDVDGRDRARRKREQLKDTAAKMGMTVDELEAARSKTKRSDKAPSPLRKAESRRETGREGGDSPLRGGAGSPRGGSPVRSSGRALGSAEPAPDRFSKRPKAEEGLVAKATNKVLAVLGLGQSKSAGASDLNDYTAEMDLELRALLSAHMAKVAAQVHAPLRENGRVHTRTHARRETNMSV